MNTLQPTGEELHKAWKSKPGRTKAQVAAFFGLSYGQAAGRIWRYERSLTTQEPDIAPYFHIDRDQPLVLEGDWLIVGDVHCPTTDYDMAQLLSMVAERRGITNLLIAGDLLNMDIFSVHPSEDVPIPWKKEKAAARALLLEWMGQFRRIIYTAGNHERRLSKATWGAYGMEDIRDLIIGHHSPIEVSRYGYCTIQTAIGPWRITHPKKYSKMPIKTGSDLAMRTGMHTWVMHQHHLGVSWSECGRYLVVNGGGLFEPSSLDYVTLDDTVMPAMRKGFGVLEDGHPTVFGEFPYTDWMAVLGEENRQRVPLSLAA